MSVMRLLETEIAPNFVGHLPFEHFPAEVFPTINPIHWLTSHFAVGGWSPLQRLSGMLTAHMTRIAPQNGFTWHPHRNLEIYTWVLEGQLYHEDTTGGRGVIQAGELQRMYAGQYIEHQELNPFDDPARVIQIWFIADLPYWNLAPHYQQVGRAELPVRPVQDATVYSLIGDGSPMDSHVNARLSAAFLEPGQTTIEAPQVGEQLFLYVTDGAGQVTYAGQTIPLKQYDVILATPAMQTALVESDHSLRWLNFYLPDFLGMEE